MMRQWWEDYGEEKIRLDTAWRDEHYPGRSLARLDTPIEHKRMASKYAHRMVARREGVEDELPDDFDDIDGDEVEYDSQEGDFE